MARYEQVQGSKFAPLLGTILFFRGHLESLSKWLIFQHFLRENRRLEPGLIRPEPSAYHQL